MISIPQIRAARALLDWTQGELADKAGLSLKALNNLERALVMPRMNTLMRLQQTLEQAGVEFGSNGSVRLAAEKFEIVEFSGDGALEMLLNDELQQLAVTGGEVVLSGVDDRRFGQVPKGVWENYYEQCKKHKITERLLILEGDDYILGPAQYYRWCKREVFGEVPYGVYGNTFFIIFWGPPIRIILMRNAAVAETYRRQFELHWAHASIPDFVRKR